MKQLQSNPWAGLIFLSLSVMVISLDNTVLNVALPSISTDLNANASDLQWIVDVYVLIFASVLLTVGTISDRIGRKRVLQIGLLWFGIGSLCAALARSTEALIVTRALMGIGGATVAPATLSTITATFQNSRSRGQAIAIWAAVFALGISIGPVLGGWLVQHFHWNAVFLINVPVILIAVIGGQFFVQESKNVHASPPDWAGVILSIIGLLALVYAVIRAGEDGWTEPHVLISFIVAIVVLGLFAAWESHTPYPMLPLRFFRNPSFSAASIAQMMQMFALTGSLFFFSQYFQSVRGDTPLVSGLLTLPRAILMSVVALSSAAVARRLGIKITVSMGMLLSAVSLLVLSQIITVDTPDSAIQLWLGIMGIGLGLANSPATNSIMGAVSPEQSGIASAMNEMTRELGAALGIAILGSIITHTYLAQVTPTLDAQFPQLSSSARALVESSIQGANQVAAQAAGLGSTLTALTHQSFVDGMRDAMVVGAIIMASAALFTFLTLPAQIHPPLVEEESVRQVGNQATRIAKH